MAGRGQQWSACGRTRLQGVIGRRRGNQTGNRRVTGICSPSQQIQIKESMGRMGEWGY